MTEMISGVENADDPIAAGEADALDEQLVERARSEEPEEAAETLREALGLWRGAALADFTYERFAQVEIARLEEAKRSAIDSRRQPGQTRARSGGGFSAAGASAARWVRC